MSKDNGGPAFPLSDPRMINPMSTSEYEDAAHGLSLRDYFAAKAMQGLCAHPEIGHNPYVKIAEAAYHQADAMLAERAK